MDNETAAGLLAALSHPARLSVFRLLVEAGPEGMNASAIAEKVGLAAPRLSFHLAHLSRAGLIRGRQEKRFIFYSANFPLMDDLLSFLSSNCCQGQPCLPKMATCGALAPRRRKA